MSEDHQRVVLHVEDLHQQRRAQAHQNGGDNFGHRRVGAVLLRRPEVDLFGERQQDNVNAKVDKDLQKEDDEEHVQVETGVAWPPPKETAEGAANVVKVEEGREKEAKE